MPRQILGVDVGFVPDQLQFYYDSQKAVHDWRVELYNGIREVELAMLNREQTEDNPLWWVPMVGETILGFFDVFDAIFTIRDVVMYGDLAALGFLAFDVLVPVLGDAVMSIRNAAKRTGSWSEQLAKFMGDSENFSDEVYAMTNLTDKLPEGGNVRWKTLEEPFDTLDDATEWMKEHYPNINFDPTGADPLAISQAIDEFHYLSQRWPQLAEQLAKKDDKVFIITNQTVRTEDNSFLLDLAISESNYSAFSYEGNIVLNVDPIVNVNEFNFSLSSFVNEDFNLGDLGVGINARGVTTHEFAHLVYDFMENSEKLNALRSFVKKNTPDVGEGIKGLSKYATMFDNDAKRARESFAEGFVALYNIPRQVWPEGGYIEKQFEFLNRLFGENWWNV